MDDIKEKYKRIGNVNNKYKFFNCICGKPAGNAIILLNCKNNDTLLLGYNCYRKIFKNGEKGYPLSYFTPGNPLSDRKMDYISYENIKTILHKQGKFICYRCNTIKKINESNYNKNKKERFCKDCKKVITNCCKKVKKVSEIVDDICNECKKCEFCDNIISNKYYKCLDCINKKRKKQYTFNKK